MSGTSFAFTVVRGVKPASLAFRLGVCQRVAEAVVDIREFDLLSTGGLLNEAGLGRPRSSLIIGGFLFWEEINRGKTNGF